MLPDLVSVQRVLKTNVLSSNFPVKETPGKPMTCISEGEPRASGFPTLNADFVEKMWIRSHPHVDSNTGGQGAKAKDICVFFIYSLIKAPTTGEIPWSQRWFSQGEAWPLLSGCVDPVISPKVGRLDYIIYGSGGLLRSPIRGGGSYSNPPSTCKSLFSFRSFLLSIIFFKVVKIKMKSCGSNSRLKSR